MSGMLAARSASGEGLFQDKLTGPWLVLLLSKNVVLILGTFIEEDKEREHSGACSLCPWKWAFLPSGRAGSGRSNVLLSYPRFGGSKVEISGGEAVWDEMT